MLKPAINIAIFGAFVLIVAVLGFFLWRTLFTSEKHGNAQPEAKPAYSDQGTSAENSSRASPTPSVSNATDEAIAEYTKWVAIFTLFLVLATIGLFISGERNVEVARQSADAAARAADVASEALIASTRAWLAPSFVALNTPIESGPPISFQIHMINSGKEPALNGVWGFKYYLIPYVTPSNAPSENIGPNLTCEGVEPADNAGIIIYPASSTNFWLPLEIPDTPEDRKLISAASERHNSLVIEGCIAYRSSGKTRKSWFRFFLRDVEGQPSFIVNKEGNRVQNWRFNAMTTGNGAT
jgi:hypothetical protein